MFRYWVWTVRREGEQESHSLDFAFEEEACRAANVLAKHGAWEVRVEDRIHMETVYKIGRTIWRKET